jgi:hypothetical protein
MIKIDVFFIVVFNLKSNIVGTGASFLGDKEAEA